MPAQLLLQASAPGAAPHDAVRLTWRAAASAPGGAARGSSRPSAAALLSACCARFGAVRMLIWATQRPLAFVQFEDAAAAARAAAAHSACDDAAADPAAAAVIGLAEPYTVLETCAASNSEVAAADDVACMTVVPVSPGWSQPPPTAADGTALLLATGTSLLLATVVVSRRSGWCSDSGDEMVVSGGGRPDEDAALATGYAYAASASAAPAANTVRLRGCIRLAPSSRRAAPSLRGAAAALSSSPRSGLLHVRSSGEEAAAAQVVAAPCDSAALTVGGASGPSRHSEAAGEPAAAARSACATPAIEARHVHALYEAIAPHFSATRHSGWPRITRFLRELAAASAGAALTVLDAGCGNGKYMGGGTGDGDDGGASSSSALQWLGVDRSAGLLAIAGGAARRHEVLRADALRLPLRARAVDAAICIAVLHHISAPPRRVRLIAELLRVVRPAARAQLHRRVPGADAYEPAAAAAPPPLTGAGVGDADPSATGLILLQAWALEQASPTAAAAGTGSSATGSLAQARPVFAAPACAADGVGQGAAAEATAAEQARDRFVPWRLPAAGIVHAAGAAAGAAAASGSEAAAAESAARLAALAAAGGEYDAAKRSVVVQRYCHMYARGELEALVRRAVEGEGEGEGGALLYSPQVAAFVRGAAADAPAASACVAEARIVAPPAAGAGGVLELRDALLRRPARDGDDAAAAPSPLIAELVETWWERGNWCLLMRRLN